MVPWHTVGWILFAPSCLLALYRLHRLCLWLEKRGWLYYWHKKPAGGGGSGFVALQEFLEPPTQHIHQVKEEKHRTKGEKEAGPNE
jgi:hypothetical protein